MRILYNSTIDPGCRKIRLVLAEKKIPFQIVNEDEWKGKKFFYQLNPLEVVPFLYETDGFSLCDSGAIAEYIDESFPDPLPLMGDNIKERSEVRRLTNWFDNKFYQEVTVGLVNEKLLKGRFSNDPPDSRLIRLAHSSISFHMSYFTYLLDRRTWIAGEFFSMADLAGAAQFSSIDYGNGIDWNKFPLVKNWYSLIKSRPSFRDILKDRLPGISPSLHYTDLDF
jgi:glutathione S-transferase